jgi:hypothetical protein
VSELYRPSLLVTEVLWIVGARCYSVTDPYSRILGFLDRSRYFFFQVAPHLYSLANFLRDRGCHMVSVTDLYGRILGFLDRSRYFFYQVAPQLYSRA